MSEPLVFLDFEVSTSNHKIFDIGAIRHDGKTYRGRSLKELVNWLPKRGFIGGHNIINHDLKYLFKANVNFDPENYQAIDTLYLSALLFPRNPYHSLVKDKQLQSEELNNPLNDAITAGRLFKDEIKAFHSLPEDLQYIYYGLLRQIPGFSGFFSFLNICHDTLNGLSEKISQYFSYQFCTRAAIRDFVNLYPVELAYALAIIHTEDSASITPPWVIMNFPEVSNIILSLRSTPCHTPDCRYCQTKHNIRDALSRYFGYESFRTYDGSPLQEEAVQAAVDNQSLIAIFPTGGGKSLTFQLPALMAGETSMGLTVVISPLQSLMKDQVDNLEKRGITEATTINGLLDPIARSKAFERVQSGTASLLYISPESLRSRSIEKLIAGRTIVRFVIDEAHCFSSWGHDFRVDYLYIGEFIRNIQQKREMQKTIPVSCFTATARKKVIADIENYFREKLSLKMKVFRSGATRSNLHYKVFEGSDDSEKYNKVRELLTLHDCPTIIYVSRTSYAVKLAEKLSDDGYPAVPFHGKLSSEEKTENQNRFINGEIDVVVATSAFGMGVDKGDVGVVIHYEISNSLENYVQEAGRAGRDTNLVADCYILFNEEDLNKHFLLHNQTKLSIKEIQQIWRAVKDFTKKRDTASQSPLEIARKAGWDDQVPEIETRVTTAIATLEQAGYLKRKQNLPQLFATSIRTRTADEAISKINSSELFSEEQKQNAIRIIKRLFSAKSKKGFDDEEAESRIDYLSDRLSIDKKAVIKAITLMREIGILADHKDLSAFLNRQKGGNRSMKTFENFAALENYFADQLEETESSFHLRELNEAATEQGLKNPGSKKIRSILNYWAIKKIVKRRFHSYSANHFSVILLENKDSFKEKRRKRHELSRFILSEMFQKVKEQNGAPEASADNSETFVQFSVGELVKKYGNKSDLFAGKTSVDEIEEALFFLSKIEAIKIEGGFMVIYNRMTIDRLEKNNQIQFKKEDYQQLKNHYDTKVKQIHIVGEYAKHMMQDTAGGAHYVADYFKMDLGDFESKYFPGEAGKHLKRNMTHSKFKKLFASLSDEQRNIINNHQSEKIVVLAGPGSGKTRVLVHKLAAILLLEDVKHEQLLMLTFSRSAAVEFKKRLLDLVGNLAHRIDIKTFYSYCFDLLDKKGNLEKSADVIKNAISDIKAGNVEPSKITKSMLVIDEAQDMSADEFALVECLSDHNENMKIVAVGDDDQNIYGFRGSDNRYLKKFASADTTVVYELLTNYRSKKNIVAFNNQYLNSIPDRMKSRDLQAYASDNGKIRIFRYADDRQLAPLIEDLRATDLKGSTAILTRTNEDVLKIHWHLRKSAIPATILYGSENAKLADLEEIRTFLNVLDQSGNSSVIPLETWNKAKKVFHEKFRSSANYEVCKELIKSFQEINTKFKFRSDFEHFIRESAAEDFIRTDEKQVVVSTLHKSKGREFDHVILHLGNFNPKDAEEKRLLYVGLSRAKCSITVHYDHSYFQHLIVDDLRQIIEKRVFPPSNYLSLQLGYKDVHLGYFRFVQQRMKNLMAGSFLIVGEEGLCNAQNELVLKFSEGFREKLKGHLQKGYVIEECVVRHVVYWKKDEKEEVRVILPLINLVKKTPTKP